MPEVINTPDFLKDIIDNLQKLSDLTHQTKVSISLLKGSGAAKGLNDAKLDSAIENLWQAADKLNDAALNIMATEYQAYKKADVLRDSN